DVPAELVRRQREEGVVVLPAAHGLSYRHRALRIEPPVAGAISFTWCGWSPGIGIDADTGEIVDDAVAHSHGTGQLRDLGGHRRGLGARGAGPARPHAAGAGLARPVPGGGGRRRRGGWSVSGRVAALLCAGVLVVSAATAWGVGPGAATVAAASDGGASSRVVGRGDIVTTIIGWRLGARVPARRGVAPRCRWVTMTDAQIEWLAAASSRRVLADGAHPVLDAVRAHLALGTLPDGDLQA